MSIVGIAALLAILKVVGWCTIQEKEYKLNNHLNAQKERVHRVRRYEQNRKG